MSTVFTLHGSHAQAHEEIHVYSTNISDHRDPSDSHIAPEGRTGETNTRNPHGEEAFRKESPHVHQKLDAQKLLIEQQRMENESYVLLTSLCTRDCPFLFFLLVLLFDQILLMLILQH